MTPDHRDRMEFIFVRMTKGNRIALVSDRYVERMSVRGWLLIFYPA